MTIGLVGKKSGMTRVFTENGDSLPVTVIEVEPNRVTLVKTLESDGYRAVQVTTGSRKAKHLTKAAAGQYAKAGIEAGRSLMEFRLDEGDDIPEVGGEFTVSLFEAGQKIDVTGTSKGKGFQGAVKRWNFRTQDMTHGNSLSHRRRVPSVCVRRRVASSRARKWPVSSVIRGLRYRAWKLSVSIPSVTCC